MRKIFKQIIIARKDLKMSPGKLAAQVSHASIAFLTTLIREGAYTSKITKGDIIGYKFDYVFEKDLFEQWINGAFTKVVLQARNKNHLLKVKSMAEEFGMKEGEDYFCIYDNCNTELNPEEENGTTLTCIGFKPMDAEVIDQVGGKYHLYM